jgi:hypothetical protein
MSATNPRRKIRRSSGQGVDPDMSISTLGGRYHSGPPVERLELQLPVILLKCRPGGLRHAAAVQR